MGAVADRLLRLIVVTHEPAESYEVEDLLRDLTDVPAPEKLSSMGVWNSGKRGWAPDNGLGMAKA